eukprot:7186504-Prymnesium_polylepis.1
MATKLLVFAWAAAAAAHPGHSHRTFECHHGAETGHTDQDIHAPQHYADDGGDRRRALQSSAGRTFAPVRIVLRYTSIDALNATQQSFLLNELLPAAVGWLEQALAVEPVAGPLLFARDCARSYITTSSVCKEERVATCGTAANGAAAPIPDELLAAQTVCATCIGDDCCCGSSGCSSNCGGQASSCSTSADGAGVTGDFVLVVSSVHTASCANSTLAYASTCQRDQYDRPILGDVNCTRPTTRTIWRCSDPCATVCPERLSAAPRELAEQRAVAVHEMLHALGFTSSSWPLFRMPDGRTPRTPRGSDGSVPYTANYTCPTGAVGTVRVPATNTIAVGSERGVTVARMVTPKVRSVARDVFGCDTLGGAELENQPTWLGSCWGSHWEQAR